MEREDYNYPHQKLILETEAQNSVIRIGIHNKQLDN